MGPKTGLIVLSLAVRGAKVNYGIRCVFRVEQKSRGPGPTEPSPLRSSGRNMFVVFGGVPVGPCCASASSVVPARVDLRPYRLPLSYCCCFFKSIAACPRVRLLCREHWYLWAHICIGFASTQSALRCGGMSGDSAAVCAWCQWETPHWCRGVSGPVTCVILSPPVLFSLVQRRDGARCIVDGLARPGARFGVWSCEHPSAAGLPLTPV